MSDKLKTEQSSAVENHPKGSRSVMEQYCEELRKWVVEVHCWQAFHQYNVAVAAYQSWQQSLSVDVLRQRRHENTTEAVDTNNAADANNFGNADGQLERLVFPVPTSAREVAVIRNPDGSDVLAAQFVVASYVRRFMAEVIDFVFAFFIKLLLIYYLVEMEIVDLSRFDKLLGSVADLQMLVDVTQELFPLELLGKLACSLLEALCLSQSSFPQFCGQTPGKYFLGLRVIECDSVAHVAGAPLNVVRVNGSVVVPFKAAMLRSMLKNILINSLVPFSTVAFAFNHNRAIYDIMARTIVIVD